MSEGLTTGNNKGYMRRINNYYGKPCNASCHYPGTMSKCFVQCCDQCQKQYEECDYNIDTLREILSQFEMVHKISIKKGMSETEPRIVSMQHWIDTYKILLDNHNITMV
jgi:hypothetical protein